MPQYWGKRASSICQYVARGNDAYVTIFDKDYHNRCLESSCGVALLVVSEKKSRIISTAAAYVSLSLVYCAFRK